MPRSVLPAVLVLALGCETAASDTCEATPMGGGGLQIVVDGEPHVVDGAFSSAREWLPESRMEGLLTDVYFDYEAPTLHVLNDWRANVGGISPDCFNLFALNVGAERVELRVYGDGRVDVAGIDGPVEGAYGFGPSPQYPFPHTIFEFSIALPAGQVDVCCRDPVSSSECDQLVSEPVAFSITTGEGLPRIRRTVAPSIPRLTEGGACGRGEGLCAEGLSCSALGRARPVCVAAGATALDAGIDAGSDGGADAGADAGADGGPSMPPG